LGDQIVDIVDHCQLLAEHEPEMPAQDREEADRHFEEEQIRLKQSKRYSWKHALPASPSAV
jgi:hypothetical protein